MKVKSNLAAMDETASTEEDLSEQKLFPVDAEWPNDDKDVEHQINDRTDEPETVDATPSIATATNITSVDIPSNGNKKKLTNALITMNQ